MAAGAARGETPMENPQAMRTNQYQEQDFRVKSFESQVESLREVEQKWSGVLNEIQRINRNLTLSKRNNPELELRQRENILKLQDVRNNIIIGFTDDIEQENEIRREYNELRPEDRKPELTVSVKRLNQIIEGMKLNTSNFDNLGDYVDKMSKAVSALEQEAMNIQKIIGGNGY